MLILIYTEVTTDSLFLYNFTYPLILSTQTHDNQLKSEVLFVCFLLCLHRTKIAA